MTRLHSSIAILGIGLLAACGGSDASAPITVLGYTVTLKSAPPSTAPVGASIPIAFTIAEHNSDGSSNPAGGKTMTVAVTAGGGTVGGATSTALTSSVDGSVSTTWVLGATVGTQTLRGSVTSTEYMDVSLTATPVEYLLSLTPNTLTVGQGTNASTAVTITRTNFTGAVTLSLGGAPAGVTGLFNPVAPTGTSSTLTVSVGAAVAAGVYNLTVNGTAAGTANQSTSLTLTVPTYSLSLIPAAITIKQGASDNAEVTITRTNFTGTVALSLGSAPVGVTGVFVPAAPTGPSSALTVTVGAAVAPGVYNLTVDGTGTPGNRSTPLTLTVPPPGDVATADFSVCLPAARPVWLAFQDGTGPWTVVTGVSDVYTMSITSGKGGLAYVLNTSPLHYSIQVHYRTQAEFTARPLVLCTPPAKTVNGTVAGFFGADHFLISLGGGSTTLPAFFTDPNFQIIGVGNGNQDLVGYRQGGSPQSAIIRRDQNIADGGSLAIMDYNGTEAFSPASSTITLGGLFGGETVSQSMFYQVGATCQTAPLYTSSGAGPAFTVYGIPAARQRASDYHGVSFTAASGTTASRSIREYFHTLSVRTVTLGIAMPLPVLTRVGGPYERLQAVYSLPTEYNASTAFFYDNSVSPDVYKSFVSLTATVGYLGSPE